MKILVISQYYKPEQFKINDIAEKLVKLGHQVTVLTGRPNYPSGKLEKGYTLFNKRNQIMNNVKIIRSFEFPRRTGVLFLAINYLSFLISASLKVLLLKKDYDIIYVYQLSPIYVIFPALIFKWRSKIPLYVYVCDIWPDSLYNYVKNDKSWIFRLNSKFSTYLYNHVDYLGVTSKPFKKYLVETHNITGSKIQYLPQHAEEELLKIPEPIDNQLIDFMFMGNIGLVQDVDTIIKAVYNIREKSGFSFHFVGDGSYLDSAKKLVNELGLNEIIIFHGRHDFSKMPSFYNFADVCVLTLKSSSIVGNTIPTKLQGYMAAGRPVLAAINGAATEIISDAECGCVTNASNIEELSKLMIHMINSKHLHKMGENGRQYFLQHFTLEKHVHNLTHTLNKLFEEANNV